MELIVKVSNRKERFWVRVVNIENGIVYGIVDNQLVDGREYNFGDEIEFPVSEIVDVFSAFYRAHPSSAPNAVESPIQSS
jgi:uncharacterized protein YegJ (DUF2314 family)